MPATNFESSTNLGNDNLDDDLFDYDAEIPDLDTTIKTPTAPPDADRKDTLGIDEEVKIRKKRIVVKLDEARLMSNLGIPKLREDAPKKIKFKGKGHEYRDTARLLSYYQFWTDDLYKKAKFRDTLKIIEKLGHSKSMRDQRLSWINETKREDKLSQARSPRDIGQEDDAAKETRGPQKEGRASGSIHDDDDLCSLPQQRVVTTGAQTGEPHASFSGGLFLPRGGESSDDEDFGAGPNDDELDALMDIERAVTSVAPSGSLAAVPVGIPDKSATDTVTAPPPDDDFEDEMEAMADFGPPPEW